MVGSCVLDAFANCIFSGVPNGSSNLTSQGGTALQEPSSIPDLGGGAALEQLGLFLHLRIGPKADHQGRFKKMLKFAQNSSN